MLIFLCLTSAFERESLNDAMAKFTTSLKADMVFKNTFKYYKVVLFFKKYVMIVCVRRKRKIRAVELGYTWVISKFLHTVCFLFKNEFILQSTFTGLQCNLHCALLQLFIVWASLVILSGRLRC
jgi:hypothetical protein